MKSFIKWGAIIIGCLVVVIIAALILVPMFVDVQKYKPVLESKVTEATGRPFSVGDDLHLSLFPWAGVSFSDLRLGNPAGFAEKDFVTVKSFEVRIKLLPLLSKDIQIKNFVLNEPRIVLVKNEKGRANWEQPQQTSKDTPTRQAEKAPPGDIAKFELPISALTVGNLAINNGSALWDDRTTGTRKEISQINLALKDVSLERPLTLTFSALIDQKPFSLEGSVGPLGQGFQIETIPMDLSLKALKQLAMRLKGSLENPLTNPGVDMDIEIAEFSPRELVAELGQEFPVKTSDPKALNSIALKTHVKADAGKASLTNGIINLDQSKLNFSATALDFSRPNLKFDLDLDQINLDRYMPPPSDQPPPEKTSGKAKSTGEKTDFTPLRRMILDGTAKIGQLTVSKARIQDVSLQIKAKDGIIKLDPMNLKMYQGNATGWAVLNVVKNTPQSDLKLRINDIQINPLLKDVLEKDFLEGRTNADIQLAIVGNTPEQIKKTLNGNGDLRFNDGAIVGIDLASMARNVGSAFGLAKKGEKRPRTDFTELSMPFTIKNGVTNTPQSILKSPFIRIIVAGTADLVKETLDFRVEPKAIASIKGQGDEGQRSGLMVPVLVSGTFSSPKFRPDLSAAAQQKIEKQIFESKEAQKLLDKKELKPFEKEAKGALKGLLGN
ncbi:MAG: AsmA family protein [Deltaproteobacteria bacterium]|nr:AsmA family protein [Deltaproteobacteria bacterium]